MALRALSSRSASKLAVALCLASMGMDIGMPAAVANSSLAATPSGQAPAAPQENNQDGIQEENAAPETASVRQLDSFAAMRNALLEVIARATKRVWLTTDYLTDGEIVSALYIAKYRKVDINVLLSRARANGYMSRLNYLKNQNVPVFIRPDHFKAGAQTAVLSDDTLILINSDLDFLTRQRRFFMTTATPEVAKQYQEGFAAAANQQIPAVPRPVPLVGRAGHPAAVAPRPGSRLPEVRNSYPSNNEAASGSAPYNYNNMRSPKPAGVPDKLPRNTIQQRRGAPATETNK